MINRKECSVQMRSKLEHLALGALLIATPLVSSSASFAYELPLATKDTVQNESLKDLQRISHGVATITRSARGAIVFVSVSKTLAQQPMGGGDPFDFFFGWPYPNGEQAPNGPRRPMPPPKQEGVGSGFIIDLDKGYIVTNNHV